MVRILTSLSCLTYNRTVVTTDTETTVELNVAFLKVKHTIKRKRDEKSD